MTRISRALTLALALACASPALAIPVAQKGDTRLEVGSLARLGYAVDSTDGETTQAPYIQSARLSAKLKTPRFGRAAVQVEGRSGQVKLLDAMVEVRPHAMIGLRAGVYRLPTTIDNQSSASKIPFRNRSMLVGLTQRRITGAELDLDLEAAGVELDVRLGWFQPTEAARALLPDGEGNFASARFGADFANGLGLHLGYLGLVLAENDPIADPTDPDAAATRPVPLPQVVDVGVSYGSGPWSAVAEFLYAPPEGDDDPTWAAYAHVLRRIDGPDGLVFAPGARYGLLDRAGTLTQRVTVGSKVYLADSGLELIPNYELTVDDEATGHTLYFGLQAGF